MVVPNLGSESVTFESHCGILPLLDLFIFYCVCIYLILTLSGFYFSFLAWLACIRACNWWLIFSYYKKKKQQYYWFVFHFGMETHLIYLFFCAFRTHHLKFLNLSMEDLCCVPFIRCNCLKEYLMILGCLLICNFCRADIQIRKALCLIVVYGWFIKISSYRYLHWIFAEVN